ncbi:MAG: hypothetical protein NZ529_07265 [Cytophagaceae bacterium]|nr:hypothetical protein [Cytophagaceae bacterium]MDW8456582.1 hypothetical protein [Cytophagaceae bacterium]
MNSKIRLIVLAGTLSFFSFIMKDDVSRTRKQSKAPISSDCKCKGKKLYGKVKFVNSSADIKVQVVQSFPDLKVKLVRSFPDECGEWQVVESFPDFTVQVVNSFPDIKIKYVDNFPGLK